MTQEKQQQKVDSWVTYRPEIKLLDCTIRDGGLINDHKFDDQLVKAVYETCVAAGINYMELGYKASKKIFSPDKFGKWKFCDEDDIRKIVGENKTSLKLSAMADAERTDYHTDILPKEKSVLDAIRVAAYIHQIPTAIDMIKDAHDKGYETIMQLMAISVVKDRELEDALKVLAQTPVSAVYLVDSFGALYSEQIRDLTKKFLDILKGTGKEVGVHTHNNQQLAYANVIEALIVGATRLDVTIKGMGRGAGNCPMELLIGFLKNPRFKLRPVIECVEKYFLPLREKLDWGYSLPYMITGQLNMHPREAIKLRSGDKKNNYLEFYDQMIDEES
ncbi:MAG: aldolase catalytic domain-containing protein [Endomicrobiales bacterium]|nr:aldolase catalytic domain-containing protein [Endomicrobiales bacterium]